ncbi:MAG: hypothetical protein V7746_02110 [Halioglobus sp.]
MQKNGVLQQGVDWTGYVTALAPVAVVLALMVLSISLLLSVDDAVRLKQLIEDDGPVQLVGQTCIALTFVICLFYAVLDKERRSSFLPLSYLLLFYTLREADFHYKVSPFAKATQFKRFYSHEMIPLSTKLLMAAIVVLFLVVLFRYLKQERAGFFLALRQRLAWAVCALAWAGVFVMSQIVDQVPLFHNASGQVIEEVFESGAEVLALLAVILFRLELRRPSDEP